MSEAPSEAKQQYHVHIKLNGDQNPLISSSLHSLPQHHQANTAAPPSSCNGIALEFPPDMSAASSSASSSNRSLGNTSSRPVLINGRRGETTSPRFQSSEAAGAAGGFYFDHIPAARNGMNGLVRGSPPRRDMSGTLKDFHEHVLAARNHRIYAIDELSEVSGRSELVALHERMRMEQVHEILANQERQARRERPASRRPAKELKQTRTTPSPADSPPYGADSPLQSSRVSFRKCRILIPPIQTNTADDQLYSQAFDAFIFDLDLATANHSMTSLSLSQFPSRRTSHHTTSQHPSNRFSRHSSDRMNSGGYATTGGTSRIPSRSEAMPQRNNSSCCACFGFGAKVAERPSKNDWQATDRVRGGGGFESLRRDSGRPSCSEKDRLI